MSPRRSLTEQLTDYLEGRLDPDQAGAVERLLSANDVARRRFRWLGEFHDQAARTTVAQPPARVREQLMDAFRQARHIHQSEVLHDSREVMGGVRSVGVAERWAVLHVSDVADIAVDFVRAGDRVEVSGQVLTLDGRVVRGVELLGATSALAACPADDYGQYSCGEVVPGQYRLLVHLDDSTVSVDVDIDGAA